MLVSPPVFLTSAPVPTGSSDLHSQTSPETTASLLASLALEQRLLLLPFDVQATVLCWDGTKPLDVPR